MPSQYSKIQIRRGTDSELSLSTVVLASGEPVFAVDTNTLKIGDGTNTWSGLSEIGGGGGGGASDSITEGDSSVEVTDTGSDGHIDFTTENTARWEITSAGHLLPSTNADYDIGSATRKVRDLYLDGNSLHIGTLDISENSSNYLVLPPCELTGHLLPDTNAAYDLGSAEYKIRHLFLSDNSIYIGENGNKIGVSNNELVFTHQDDTTSNIVFKPTVVPSSATDSGKVGQIAVDDNYLYLCIATNTWKKILIDSIDEAW